MQFTFFENSALDARDAALAQVATNAGDWMRRARVCVAHIPVGWSGTAEDCRLLLIRAGLQPPHHHNAWGALIKSCVPSLLRPNGQWRNMKTIKSHARKTPVYVRVAA